MFVCVRVREYVRLLLFHDFLIIYRRRKNNLRRCFYPFDFTREHLTNT